MSEEDQGVGPFGEPADGAVQGQRYEWRFLKTDAGMSLNQIVDYAAAEYDQEISLETLRGHHKQGRNDFPRPVGVIGRSPVFDRDDIDDWLANRKRTPGPRPARRRAGPTDLATLKRDSPALYEQLLAEARTKVAAPE